MPFIKKESKRCIREVEKLSQKHILDQFQKDRRNKIDEICSNLQLVSLKIKDTRMRSLKLLKELEKTDYVMDGKSPNGIVSAIIFLSLPSEIRNNISREKFSDLTSNCSTTLRKRIEDIRRFCDV